MGVEPTGDAVRRHPTILKTAPATGRDVLPLQCGLLLLPCPLSPRTVPHIEAPLHEPGLECKMMLCFSSVPNRSIQAHHRITRPSKDARSDSVRGLRLKSLGKQTATDVARG